MKEIELKVLAATSKYNPRKVTNTQSVSKSASEDDEDDYDDDTFDNKTE